MLLIIVTEINHGHFSNNKGSSASITRAQRIPYIFIINMWSLYMTILILGLSSRVYALRCPKEEDIFPCYCSGFGNYDEFGNEVKELKVNCEFHRYGGDFETLRKGLRSLSGIKGVSIRLEGYNISMPSKLFSGIDVKQLIFQSCHLYSLTNDDQPWFLGLENHLEELIIDNSVTAEEKLIIGKLDKLQSLYIRWNQIPELEDDVFSNELPNLEDLYIFQNNIKKLGNNVFSQLNNLKSLSLESNQLGTIKRSMLPTTADRLSAMRLDNNSLPDFPEDIFTGMPSLKWLSLQHNQFTTLDERTWSSIWPQLTHAFFFSNNIICDERLNWISKLKKWPEQFAGKCSGPEEWKDKNLIEFFKSRQ